MYRDAPAFSSLLSLATLPTWFPPSFPLPAGHQEGEGNGEGVVTGRRTGFDRRGGWRSHLGEMV